MWRRTKVTIARHIVENKIINQKAVLKATRRNDGITNDALESLQASVDTISSIDDYDALMGIEGFAAKTYFKAYFCDLMEPLRPVIDKTVRTAWNKKQFSEKDFVIQKGEYRLKHDRNGDYCQIFFNALIPYKADVFRYIQSYYRCFMNKKPIEMYPRIII